LPLDLDQLVRRAARHPDQAKIEEGGDEADELGPEALEPANRRRPFRKRRRARRGGVGKRLLDLDEERGCASRERFFPGVDEVADVAEERLTDASEALCVDLR
jgi:hypothetical protein